MLGIREQSLSMRICEVLVRGIRRGEVCKDIFRPSEACPVLLTRKLNIKGSTEGVKRVRRNPCCLRLRKSTEGSRSKQALSVVLDEIAMSKADHKRGQLIGRD